MKSPEVTESEEDINIESLREKIKKINAKKIRKINLK